jgi:N-dimethylarginine dimethylaminohydrolase
MVRPPSSAFGDADADRWHYTSQPDLTVALKEHDGFVSVLREAGAEVLVHEAPLPDLADAIYVHDPAIVTDEGAVILSMGKVLRRGEEDGMAAALGQFEIPIHARLSDGALAEGGDLLWIDPKTLAVGQGYRTNAEGLRQLTAALRPLEVETVPVQLPYGDGPDACLHLMSFISILDQDLAVVFLPLMPVPFVELLQAKGVELVEVPEEEFPTMGPNVLALGPRRCLALEGNPVTKRRMEQAGCEVITYEGKELSLKAEGGPTCLTRPILRG